MAVWHNVSDAKAYGVICEWKSEGPLIMECNPMTYNDARELANEIEMNPRCIRVAVFSMHGGYFGNESLIPKLEG